MKAKTRFHSLAVVCLICFSTTAALADTTFVKFGSTWKYLDAGTAAPTGSGGADWRNIAFNDAAWSSGPAEFGYGEGKERTTINYGSNPSNKYITTYFRRVLNIADISLYGTIRLNYYFDDGIVIYVNGNAVRNDNIAASPVYATLASGAAAENGNAIATYDIPATNFVSGNNIIAVEVHQSSVNSSDLTFDLELIAKPVSSTAIFNFSAAWKYIDNGLAAPTGSGAADWRNIAFAEPSWKTGNGKFGYGDPVNTLVFSGCGTSNYPAAENATPGCATKFITTYFRKPFTITSLSGYTSFTINAYRDDGVVIYVNGTEVTRDFMAAGAVTYTTLATSAPADDGQTIVTYSVPTTAFVEGSNIIAVEVHQNNASSTDVTFDMQLVGNFTLAGAEPDITRGPFLQMLSTDAVSIRWSTTTANTSRVLWGNSESTLTSVISDGANVIDHELRITGLTSDTKYYYGVGSATSILKGSYRNYFTTAPLASTKRAIRIGVFGDPGTGSAMQKGSRDSYLRVKNGYNNSELAIMLGDNAYNTGTEAEHNTGFFNIYNNNLFDNHAVFSVPGNHEYANNGTRAVDHNIPYYSIFSVPTAAESGGLASGTEHYYSFNYGNIHFVMLDSYGYDGGKRLYDDTTTGLQALWLKADLAANAGTHKWTIVCMHHPPYTNGSHRTDNTGGETDLLAIRQKILPILERFGVDVVLAGHSHVYERSFLVKDHTGLSTPFNTAAAGAGTKISSSNARYDGSTPSNVASADTSAANSSCPYFTIDSVYKHGTVYVVAGSAGQIGSGSGNTYPVFYTRNQSGSIGGETGSLYLEIQDNRLDAKFAGNSGTVRDRFTIMKGVNKKTVVNTTVNTPATLNASWVGGYNWYTIPATTTATSRALAVTPSSTGTFTYYVNDSLAPKTTCIADTFMLQVTSALAVSVINYNALLKNKKVWVSWTTTQEVNSDYFTIERSANGIDYEMLMVIDGKGNSNTATNYEFTDNHPLEATSYYRLVATDKDGDKKIAGTRSVNNNTVKTFSIAIQPNPAVNNEVNTIIQSAKRQTVNIKVFASSGTTVYSKQLQVQPGTNPFRFTLPTGVYIVSAAAQDGTKTNEKILVK
ncbi:MAG: metallophosphoesterase [Chitinophagaceae bacterium]